MVRAVVCAVVCAVIRTVAGTMASPLVMHTGMVWIFVVMGRRSPMGLGGGSFRWGPAVGPLPKMGPKKAPRFIELLQLFLGLGFQTGIVVWDPIGMPNESQVFVSLVHFLG